MGKYEVTQRQWVSIMNYNPSQLYDCLDCPVENVNWNDVQIFLKKLNSRTGSIYRLPTEAEWEYAAGGGSNNRTRFGNGMDILESSGANFDASEFVESYSRAGEYRRKTIRVGSFQPNGLGLYDMSGNVLEWCSDAHEYNSSYNHESSVNPTGPANGDSRIVRGGSWNRHAEACRVTVRYPHLSGFRIYYCGFRLVMSQ
jgi:formylglycine-generating enzyme required for sulfatase activity